MRVLKTWALVSVLLLVAAAAWRWRHADFVRELTHGRPKSAIDIPFDNGTVRQYEKASPDTRQGAAPEAAPAGVRKCRRSAEIVYTGAACPAGARELPMQGGTLSVVSGQGAAATRPRQAGEPGERRSTLLEVLDRSGEIDLAHRRVERATSP